MGIPAHDLYLYAGDFLPHCRSTTQQPGGNSGAANASHTVYTNTLSYNGGKWEKHNDNLLGMESLDPMQTLDTAYTAVNGGMMAVGPRLLRQLAGSL